MATPSKRQRTLSRTPSHASDKYEKSDTGLLIELESSDRFGVVTLALIRKKQTTLQSGSLVWLFFRGTTRAPAGALWRLMFRATFRSSAMVPLRNMFLPETVCGEILWAVLPTDGDEWGGIFMDGPNAAPVPIERHSKHPPNAIPYLLPRMLRITISGAHHLWLRLLGFLWLGNIVSFIRAANLISSQLGSQPSIRCPEMSSPRIRR